MQDPNRKYRFLVKEDGLRTPVADNGAMARQMESILEWIRLPNFELAIIPRNTSMSSHLFAGFTVYERCYLRIELYGAYSDHSELLDVEPVINAFDSVFAESYCGLAAVALIRQIRDDFANSSDVDIRPTVYI